MQAKLIIKCCGCGMYLGEVCVDTADLPEELQEKISEVILRHRRYCYYYGGTGKGDKNERPRIMDGISDLAK